MSVAGECPRTLDEFPAPDPEAARQIIAALYADGFRRLRGEGR